jgi:TDG/mug DNA glycosylase family protein
MGFTTAGRALEPLEYRRVGEFGIGLTDLCKTACGNDDELPCDAFDIESLLTKINEYRPGVLAFTSKAAGTAFCDRRVEFGWQASLGFGTKVYVLPSTSLRARRTWEAGKHHWRILANAVLSGT